MRLAIRVFIGGVKRHEELVEGNADILDFFLPHLAARHAHMMAEEPGMVEIEFLDEPNENERFFRIGTDPSGMVLPVEFKIP